MSAGSRPLSFCAYITALLPLAGVPARAIRALQFMQNAAAFNLLKFSHTAPPHPPLASGGCSNPIQDTGTACFKWLKPIIHPRHSQTMRSTTLCECQSACYSLTMSGALLPLNNATGHGNRLYEYGSNSFM